MKKTTILFSMVFIQLFSCNNKNALSNKKSILTEFDNQDYQVEVFYSEKDSVYSSIDSMQIFSKENKTQIIDLKHKQINLKTNLISGLILPINNDFNFDGHNDIVTRGYSLPDFNYRSFHFLYDDKTKQFVENNSLDSLYNIELDTNNKEICASYNQNGNNGLFKYKWKDNNNLILVKKYEEYESDGEIYLSIIENDKVLKSYNLIIVAFVF